MKKIPFLFSFLLLAFTSFSQVFVGSDGKLHSASTGGAIGNLNEVSFNSDTTTFKQGLAIVGGIVYYYDGHYKAIGSSLRFANKDSAKTFAFSNIVFDNSTGIRIDSFNTTTGVVSLGSGFKYWKVNGQPTLVAIGEDSVSIVNDKGITITTDTTGTNKKLKLGVDSLRFAQIVQADSANLFDYNTRRDGYFMGSNGVFVKLDGFGVSDYIAVTEGVTYYGEDFSFSGQPPFRFLCFFDANHQPVGGSDNASSLFTTPSGVKYVKFTYNIYNEQTAKNFVFSKVQFPKLYEYLKYNINNLETYPKLVEGNFTKIIKPIKNLFDKNKAIDGTSIGNDGGTPPYPQPEYGVSDFMPVRQGYRYMASNGNELYPMRFTCYFDKNKKLLLGGSSNSIQDFDINYTNDSVKFVRVTYNITDSTSKHTFQFEESSVRTNYQKYTYNWINEPDTTYPNVVMWGEQNLKNWQYWLKNRSTPFNIVSHGDSYTDGNYFTQKMYYGLVAQGLPYGGAGYVGLLQGYGPLNNYSIDSTKLKANWAQGDWTNPLGAPNEFINWSPNAVSARAAVNNALITLTAGEAYDSVLVIYKKTTATNGFSWKINSGSYTTVSAVSSVDSVGVLAIYTGGAGSSFTITIKADFTGFEMAGFIGKKNGNVLTWHKVALTGSNASMFAQNPLFKQAITPLKADLVTLEWATNEMNANIPPSEMKYYIKRIATYHRQLKPNIDLVFIAPQSTKYDGIRAYSTPEYAKVMFELAQEMNGAYVNTAIPFGKFNQQQITDGFMSGDSVHPGTVGSVVLAQMISKVFGVPNVDTSYFSLNVDTTIEAYVAPTNYTATATYENATSITLSAGNWDLSFSGTVLANGASLSAGGNVVFVLSTTTASASGSTFGKDLLTISQVNLRVNSTQSVSSAVLTVTPNSTTTYYLNTNASYTLGTPQFSGYIRARRIK